MTFTETFAANNFRRAIDQAWELLGQGWSKVSNAPSTIWPPCEKSVWGMCLLEPAQLDNGIFGFAEFVQALALLVVIYTVTDTRYRFRIAIAPLRLFRWTFYAIGIIGAGTLATDLLYGLGIPLPRVFYSQAAFQFFFGFCFLSIVVIWTWYAFIKPPIFSRRNYKQFAQALFDYVLRGSATELPTIAAELSRSAKSLVNVARKDPDRWFIGPPAPRLRSPENYAHELLLLLGNRRLCRSVVSEAPGTAIAFFNAMTDAKRYDLPMGQFASNIVTEALLNKDSALYHEDEGYHSGLIGYLKPFSGAIFGNFELVEGLSGSGKGPLDIDLDLRFSWDAEQIEAYGRALLITLKNYVRGEHWHQHSYALYRALHNIRGASGDLYLLNENEGSAYKSAPYRKTQALVGVIQDIVKYLDKQDIEPTTLRHRGQRRPYQEDLYDDIAGLMFDVIFDATGVKSPPDLCWSIQHNLVWGDFFDMHNGKASKIIRLKLRRLLYEEVLRLTSRPNYKSARVLGICLNIFGVSNPKKPDSSFDKSYYPLRVAVIGWTKRNFMTLYKKLPDVADAAVMGSVTFEKRKQRLVKTYIKGLRNEAPKEYLELDPPAIATLKSEEDYTSKLSSSS